MNERRAIVWDHGMVAVQSLGGMLGPALFLLPDGRQVAPLHVAPWFAEQGLDPLPPLLRGLRGEWPCVPFGADAARDLPLGWSADGESFAGADVGHGHSSHAAWRFTDVSAGSVALAIDYPDGHPVRALHRRITADPAAPALDIELEIGMRGKALLPIGLHPTLRLPALGSARLVPPHFRKGMVFPLPVEPANGLLEPGALFTSLERVPARGGGTLSLAALPLAEDTEELVQLCGAEGSFLLQYPGEGYQLRLQWDATVFPSLLLWVSNRGRGYAPWNGRHVALGVEPVCAAFDLGPAVSTRPNPITTLGTPTAFPLDPHQPFRTRYRMSVEPLSH